MDYLDFVIKITGKAGDEFTVNVESPAGQGQSTLRLPYDPDDLVTILQALGATFRGGAQTAAEEAASAKAAEAEDGIVGRGERISVSVPKPTDVGRKLFEHLLTGEARALFNRSVGRVQENDDLGLRLKLQLNLDDPEVARLARLPWELLYSKEEHEYLNLIGKYPLVRHLAISQPERSEVIYPPLRVLVVMSNPKGVAALDLEHEKRLIEENWADHENVEVTFLEKATLESLNRQVIENEFHVLHYMGHGDFDPESGQGVLIMEDDEGNADPIPASSLSVVLRKAKKMRLIFLNACETAKSAETKGQDPFAGVATALVMANVGDVLAMQFPISDKAAIKFSQAFYWSIATGLPIDAAVSEGRSAIKLALPNSMEWATPVLFMRSESGIFFDMKQPVPPPTPDPVPPPSPPPTSRSKVVWVAAIAAVAVVAVVGYLVWDRIGGPPDLAGIQWTFDQPISLETNVPEATRNVAEVQLELVGCDEWGPGGCERTADITGRSNLEAYEIAWSLEPDSSAIARIVSDSVAESVQLVKLEGLTQPGTVTLVAEVSNADGTEPQRKEIRVEVPRARTEAATQVARRVLASARDPETSFDSLIGEAQTVRDQYPYALEGATNDSLREMLGESVRLKALFDEVMQSPSNLTVAEEHAKVSEFLAASAALRPDGSPEVSSAESRRDELATYMNSKPVMSAQDVHGGVRNLREMPIEACTRAITSGSRTGRCADGTVQDNFAVGQTVWLSFQFVSRTRSGGYAVSIEGPGNPSPSTERHAIGARPNDPSHAYNSFVPEQPGTYTIRVTNDDARLVGRHSVVVE